MNEVAKIRPSGSVLPLITDRSVITPQTRPVVQQDCWAETKIIRHPVMQINFGQIYATPGVTFPWTIYFQKRLGEKVTALVGPGSKFITSYGEHWSLMIRISAKRGITSSEILGPSVFRKNCSVEYSIFLPYDQIPQGSDFAEPALHSLLAGVREVLTKAGIEHNDLDAAQHRLVVEFSKDPRTVETKEFAQQAVASDGQPLLCSSTTTDSTAPADAL